MCDLDQITAVHITGITDTFRRNVGVNGDHVSYLTAILDELPHLDQALTAITFRPPSFVPLYVLILTKVFTFIRDREPDHGRVIISSADNHLYFGVFAANLC